MSLLQTTSSTRQSDLLGQTTCCPEEHGDSGRTRTPNLLIRSQLLYPVELRNHVPSDEDIISTGLISSAQICASFDIESPVADRRIPCPYSPARFPARIQVCQPSAIMIVRGYAYAGPHKPPAAYDQEAAARHGYRPARSSASRPHFGYRRNCRHMPLA